MSCPRRRCTSLLTPKGLTLTTVLALVTYYLYRHDPGTRDYCPCPQETKQRHEDSPQLHNLCILVPFRDRFEELLEFVPRITAFLNHQQVAPKIFVISQTDVYRFNRASLLNVGFIESQKKTKCDYVALHDVDLVPRDPRLEYKYPEDGPLHLAAPGLHPKYNYESFLGGILLITTEHFKLLNGMSNKYWGWGLEDDEFRSRIKDAGLKIHRPDVSDFEGGMKGTFDHFHSSVNRRRDNAKCHDQWAQTRIKDRSTGLNAIRYHVRRESKVKIDGFPVIVFNVNLECDVKETPWCDCRGAKLDIEPWKKKGLKRTDDVIVPIIKKNRIKRQVARSVN